MKRRNFNSRVQHGLVATIVAFSLVGAVVTTASAQQAVDPSYKGSSFNEVLSVINGLSYTPQNATERAELAVYQRGLLPQYPVNFWSLGGIAFDHLFAPSKRTLKERADYYPRLEKFVHANGICMTGTWSITEPTPYTGFYKQGSQGLFIGRVSTALEETTSAGDRGFGLAGKIFPTMNADSKVETTNFFTVDILSGAPSQRFLDQALTNDPPLSASFDLAGPLSKIIPAFLTADTQPTFRPVTQIARIAETAAVSGQTTVQISGQISGQISAPVYMRLRAAAQTVKNDSADFRAEIEQAMKQNGQHLVFLIDTSSIQLDRNATAGWSTIGRIDIDSATVSYGCDRRLHFSHPKDDKSNKKK